MANLQGFDASQVEPTGTIEPVPAGEYIVVITDSEMKPNKGGTGHLLRVTFQVIEGDYKNRLLWAHLNLDHPNATAMQIAQADLSAICRAVGVLTPQDSVELHNLPLVIKVRCRKRDDTGEIVNEIKGYAQRDSSPPVAAATASGPAPWMRK